MFKENDMIYTKKYFGEKLKADTRHKYKIIEIYKTKNCVNDNIMFEKWALLDNGKQNIIYSYNILTKEKEYFVEHVAWYSKIFCCI
jgi:hypothetical protein